ncbi:MAG TPA: CRTAC1 family protein [Verrucomicrobiales bacterium]|nr:CRTAC1 family protein [Verrucomicrobiales bacterium]
MNPFTVLPSAPRLLPVAWAALLSGLSASLCAQSPPPDPATLARFQSLLEEQRSLDATVWAEEREAQRHEQTFVALWDALLDIDRKNEGDPFAVLASVPLQSLRLGQKENEEMMDHQIQSISLAPGPVLDAEGWRRWLESTKQNGFRLVQSEWHHAAFRSNPGGNPESEISVVLHIDHLQKPLRIALEGLLHVVWSGHDDEQGRPIPESVDASRLRVLQREGPPAFHKILAHDPSAPGNPGGIHPLLAQDLDGDGLTELVAAGCNTVFHFDQEGTPSSRPFLAHPVRTAETGLLADVTGDGYLDYVAPDTRGDLLLYRGAPDGTFPHPPTGRTQAGGPLRQPTTITAGDIDGDGDLDLWIGQYRISYLQGAMPTPYYDANDGFPAFLLRNTGGGSFEDATEEAGLEPKSRRRTYTSALVDLDDDGDLDLLVVSDFAGIDVYHNDGSGKFTDVTDSAVDERHLFGMSATFGDYNLDGLLDFYVAGMGSTTARRLEKMGARRTDDPMVESMRMAMAYGNRMYLRQPNTPNYQHPAFKDRVARTGWTWGVTSPDIDNDGDRDIFVANGHSSGASTKDHCSTFWCHDIYKPTSEPDHARHLLFQEVHRGYFDRSESWDGYQKSHLLLNRDGQDFVNVAWLLGVADEFDGRAALSEDFDGDGRMDLAIVEDRWSQGQILHVYRNMLETPNRWIGVRLPQKPGQPSPLGARVILTTDSGRRQPAAVVAGETLHGQHSSSVHFGLGPEDGVKSIEILWAGGKRKALDSPEPGRYHTVAGP